MTYNDKVMLKNVLSRIEDKCENGMEFVYKRYEDYLKEYKKSYEKIFIESEKKDLHGNLKILYKEHKRETEIFNNGLKRYYDEYRNEMIEYGFINDLEKSDQEIIELSLKTIQKVQL